MHTSWWLFGDFNGTHSFPSLLWRSSCLMHLPVCDVRVSLLWHTVETTLSVPQKVETSIIKAGTKCLDDHLVNLHITWGHLYNYGINLVPKGLGLQGLHCTGNTVPEDTNCQSLFVEQSAFLCVCIVGLWAICNCVIVALTAKHFKYSHFTIASPNCTLHTAAIAHVIRALNQQILTCYTPSEFAWDSAIPTLKLWGFPVCSVQLDGEMTVYMCAVNCVFCQKEQFVWLQWMASMSIYISQC